MDSGSKFIQTIKTEEELRALIGFPSDLVRKKSISVLDHHCREFISKSPFLVISTTDEHGRCDASPRGDYPGFVYVEDDRHLIIPERPGNKRLDSLRNLLVNAGIGMLFMIPGMGETLRINGTATLIKNIDILEKLAFNGRAPLIGIRVEVEECYLHCAKAFKRSGLWNPESWMEEEKLPKAAAILRDHAQLPDTTEEMISERLIESYTKRLY